MKVKHVLTFVSLVIICLIYHGQVLAQKADLVLTNGKIFTSDTSHLHAEAIAIKGNKIMAVGTNEAVNKVASAKTKRIDLKGKTVVPGFNDAHDHLAWLIPSGKFFYSTFSVPGLSKKDVIDSISRLVKHASPGQWIQGTIGLSVFSDPSVRRQLLDSLAPHNPLVLYVMWGHGMVVNSAALKSVHISDTAPDPLAGWYERKPGTNQITGALYEYAQFPVWEAVAIAEPANLIKALRLHAQEELGFGITTVQNMSSTLQANAAKRFFKEADLPLRTRIIPMPGTTPAGRSMVAWNNVGTKLSALTYVSGVKYLIDGTTLEQLALRTKPYPGRGNWYGKLDFPVDTIKQILREALTSNRQLMLHIVGDSSTKVVLSLMKQIGTTDQWKKKRMRIEHGTGVLTDATMKDVKDLGIVIDHTPQYGMKSPLRSWLANDIPVSIGPDGLINPYLNILFATTQQTDPKENISREQAVIAYTRGSAYAEFAEDIRGTLAPGKLADIAVLSQDIFTIPAQKLPLTRSVLTIVNGKIVYNVKR